MHGEELGSLSGSSRNGQVKRLSRTRVVADSEASVVGVRRAVSLQNVVTLLCLVGILVSSALATTVMYERSQSEAVAMTRESGDAATAKCFSAADSALTDTVSDLLGRIVNSTADRVAGFLLTTVHDTEKASYHLEHTYSGANVTDWDFLLSITHLFHASIEVLSSEGLALSGIITDDTILLYALGIEGVAGNFLVLNDGSVEYGRAYLTTPDGKPHRDIGGAIRVADTPGYQLAKAGLMQPGETRFTTVFPFDTFIGVILVRYDLDAYGNAAYLTYSATLDEVSKYLSALTSSDTSMRLYTCTAESWIDVERKKRNISTIFPGTEQFVLTGVSHGEAHSGSVAEGYKPVLDVNATDNVTREVATGIGGRYQELYDNGDMVTMEGQLVIVSKVLIPENKLDWWIVLAMDEQAVFAPVNRQSAQIQADIAADKERVSDRIERELLLTVGIVAGAALVLICVTAGTVRMTLRPLSALMEEMVWVSTMNLDRGGGSSLSGLLELREMEVAFRKMKRNLRDYRAFVPTALLGSNNDVVVQEPPTGTVTVVFTDIVRSTELWERSLSGMNAAMEIHNEVMRKGLVRHGGYEVKTIGDSFMVTFKSSVDALRFCLGVQGDLAAEEWPADLCLDQGMMVRMGCHVGHTIPEENPLTGRRDYRGPAVNLASRCEGKAQPGSVCVTAELLAAVQGGGGYDALGEPKVDDIGLHTLKGIEGEQRLHLMVPPHLGVRIGGGVAGVRYVFETSNHEGNCSPTGSGVSSTSESLQGDFATLPSPTAMVPAKKTGLTLVRTQGTVAVCMVVGSKDVFDDCNAMVRAAVEAASQTDGVLGNVSGQTITVIWNGSKPCKLHTTSAMRFAAQIKQRTSTFMRVGLATGPLLYGNIGTHKRRFNTTLGRPLESAAACATLGHHLGTFCVLSDLSGDAGAARGAAVAPFLRLVDVWGDGSSGRTISVYELLCVKLMRQLEDAWGTGTVSDPELEAHDAAYRGALQGDEGALEKLKLLSISDDDKLSQRVQKSLRCMSRDANRSYRVKVKFTALPHGVLDEEEAASPVHGARRGSRHSVSMI